MTTPSIPSAVIPGFKVMEWLTKVREEIYRQREENPEQHAKKMKEIREKMRKKVPLQDIVCGKKHTSHA